MGQSLGCDLPDLQYSVGTFGDGFHERGMEADLFFGGQSPRKDAEDRRDPHGRGASLRFCVELDLYDSDGHSLLFFVTCRRKGAKLLLNFKKGLDKKL